MKNILTICAMAALLLSPAISQARWGLNFSAQNWAMDEEDQARNMHYYRDAAPNYGYNMTGKMSKESMGGEATLFFEGNSRFRLGVAAGFGHMPELHTRLHLWSGSNWFSPELNSKIDYVPADIYLKFTSKGGRFSLFGGGGGNFVMASTRYSESSNSGEERGTFEQKKFIPHAQAGLEFFLTKWLALNAGVKVLFGGVLDNLKGTVSNNPPGKYRMVMERDPNYGEGFTFESGPLAANQRPFQYDVGGVRANAGLRIYFK